jgi:hypothetical protein
MPPAVLARARRALASYVAPRRTLDHLDHAVLAVELSDALELVAQEYVARAHDGGATWEQIGAAFSTTPQSAHERFRTRDV